VHSDPSNSFSNEREIPFEEYPETREATLGATNLISCQVGKSLLSLFVFLAVTLTVLV